MLVLGASLKKRIVNGVLQISFCKTMLKLWCERGFSLFIFDKKYCRECSIETNRSEANGSRRPSL